MAASRLFSSLSKALIFLEKLGILSSSSRFYFLKTAKEHLVMNKSFNSQNYDKIPIHLLEEEEVDKWNQWKSKYKNQELDLSNIDLENVNLSNVDLSNVNLTKANLSDSCLAEANLGSTNLIEANLSGSNLTNANLQNANLTNANLMNAELENTNIKSVKGLAPIFLFQVIDLDSLSDEEAIKLHEEIAIYLVNNKFKIQEEIIDHGLAESLKLLWIRTWRNIDNFHFEELFGKLYENDIPIINVIPYAYIASYETCYERSHQFLDRLVDWKNYCYWKNRSYKEDCLGTQLEVEEWLKSGVFDFLDRVLECLLKETWMNHFDLDLEGIAVNVAYLTKNLLKTFDSIYIQQLKCLLLTIIEVVIVIEDRSFDLDNFVKPCILSALFHTYRDVFGEQDFNKMLDDNKEDRLREMNLTGVYLSNADLSNADLTDTDLSNANLTNADLGGANLTGADLTDADLTNANLEGIIIDENTKIKISE